LGGGTGGHIYPLVAVAKKIQEITKETAEPVDLRYFGDPGPYENYLTTNGIAVEKIISSKLRRYFSLLNFLDIFKFSLGFIQSLWKLFWFMPDAAFSKGGPGALAVVFGCRFYRIPIIIHESDSIPGLTNKISSKFARKIEIAFESVKTYFPPKKEINLVGHPVREELLKTENKKTAKLGFNFDSLKPVILILGGSQGAMSINEFILNNIEILSKKFQIIHQVGTKNFESYKNEYMFISRDFNSSMKKNYFFIPYLEANLKSAYDACDLIISRAGAGAIFEIAGRGMPSILIPLDKSANDHQRQNAYEYSRNGAAIIIERENLLVNLFIKQIEEILNDPGRMEKMSSAAKNFYQPDAAFKIAEDIINITRY
jgi:UDP-N-acetylglucosamine--N-acetylmuramyl-(pentapeptide) pyrophosphoryl-undecaprenol N-acetylglucosamine transferase